MHVPKGWMDENDVDLWIKKCVESHNDPLADMLQLFNSNSEDEEKV